VDASLYYIDWKNLQLNLVAPGDFAFTGNGSRAKSEGIEISLEAHPLAGLSVSGWASWDNAALTKVLPPGPDVGVAGDRLPYTSRFSGNVAVREEFPIVHDVNGNVALKVTYIGDRTGEFTSTELRQNLPAYTQTDFHTGVTYQEWQGTLYVNNLTDSRGIVLGGIGTAYPFAFDYIQPRTVGLTLSRKF
jgi:iron complex outermembrane receptor protein